MSDTWLKFIPTNPNFQPSLDAAEKAKAVLASLAPKAHEITVAFTDSVEFINPMGNWSGVRCPSCGADAEPWWNNAMNDSYKTHFSNLEVTAPCCGVRVSLNDLNYVWAAGFAKFVIEAMNPNCGDLTTEQIRQISDCLGCKVRRIWVHI
jgi:hypothetical protein